MRDTTLPIAIRIKATEGAAPYFTPRPRPGASLHYPCVSHHLEYVIGDNQALREALARGTEDQNSFTQDPDGDNANSQSFSSSASNNPQPRDDEPGDPNFMTTNSSPLTFDEIQEVKAAVQRLHPDADLSQLPDHLTLCECGHWVPFPCKCARIH